VEKNQRTNLASVVIACYLLTSSIKPRHYRKKKTYVGFIVDPDRRVQEHSGLHNRVALCTENFRPWLPRVRRARLQVVLRRSNMEVADSNGLAL
jgi:hypothetical protein